MKTICLMSALLFAANALAKITLPSIWGNDMVVQQKSEIHFRGKASANKPVTIVASWSEKVTRTRSDASGHWAATLSTPSAGGPFSISFSDGETLELKDILVGEVWFCSGQSNMEMPVKGFRGQPGFRFSALHCVGSCGASFTFIYR